MPSVEDFYKLPRRAIVCYATVAVLSARRISVARDNCDTIEKAISFGLSWCRGDFEWTDFADFALDDESDILSKTDDSLSRAANALLETINLIEHGDRRCYVFALAAAEQAMNYGREVNKALLATYDRLAYLYTMPSEKRQGRVYVDPISLNFVEKPVAKGIPILL